ncbi:MAG: zinc ABC transporter substrate-binding protein [Oscillospiraceae bacterium]|nr:zinc ABC transporter substrate-binding protein [Oscillospiraceae bacterium]
MILSLTSCNTADAATNNTGSKLKIVATLFPQYDFCKQIVKDKADVTLLLPPGVESHSFDPKPSDIVNIYNSDLFVYTGDNMEPWAATIIKSIPDLRAINNRPYVVNCSKNIDLLKDDDGDPDEGGYDPHIWLDPTLCERMVDNIVAGLCERDSTNADFYKSNAEDYKNLLEKYDSDMSDVVKNAKRDTLVFGGRFAYMYFLNHFGLKYETAYDSCSSTAEPSVEKIASVIDYIKLNNTPCIYYEELSDPKVATSISEATGAECLLFSTAHNITKDQYDSGVTFLDIMYANLENVKKGLD